MSDLIINQSLVKAVEKKDFCPRRYLETEILKNFEEEESIAMTRGKYFEYLATGAADRNGNVPELAPTQRGKVSTAQVRIEWQAKQFPKNLEKHDIEIVAVANQLRFNLFEEFLVTGIEDTEVLYQGEPAIMDIKTTQNIHNTFGDFAWGAFPTMDKLQAYTYTLLKYHMTGKKYRWLYYVVDYKPKPEYILLEVPNPLDHYREVYSRFRQAFLRVLNFTKNDYPPVKSEKCQKCPVTTCEFNGVSQKMENKMVNEEQILDELKKQKQASHIRDLMNSFAKFQRNKSKNYVERYESYYE